MTEVCVSLVKRSSFWLKEMLGALRAGIYILARAIHKSFFRFCLFSVFSRM